MGVCVSECVLDTPESRLSCGRMQSSQLAASVCTHSERDLQVFSSPDVHACVIRADLLEIISVYGEQATCHGGGPGERHTDGYSMVNSGQGGLEPLNSPKASFVKVTVYLTALVSCSLVLPVFSDLCFDLNSLSFLLHIADKCYLILLSFKI